MIIIDYYRCSGLWLKFGPTEEQAAQLIRSDTETYSHYETGRETPARFKRRGFLFRKSKMFSQK